MLAEVRHMADVIQFRDDEDSGPTGRAKATVISPDSVLVLSPKLLVVIVLALVSAVSGAVMFYGRIDRRIERTEESTVRMNDKLKTDVATKRDLSDMGRDLRAEIHAVQEQAANMRMHCEPTRGGGLRCQVRAAE